MKETDVHSYILDSDDSVSRKSDISSSIYVAVENFIERNHLTDYEEANIRFSVHVHDKRAKGLNYRPVLPVYRFEAVLGKDIQAFKELVESSILSTVNYVYLEDPNYELEIFLNLN